MEPGHHIIERKPAYRSLISIKDVAIGALLFLIIVTIFNNLIIVIPWILLIIYFMAPLFLMIILFIFVFILILKPGYLIGATIALVLAPPVTNLYQIVEAKTYASTKVLSPEHHHDIVAFIGPHYHDKNIENFLSASPLHVVAYNPVYSEHFEWELWHQVSAERCKGIKTNDATNPQLIGEPKTCVYHEKSDVLLSNALIYSENNISKYSKIYDIYGQNIIFPYDFFGNIYTISEVVGGYEKILGLRLESHGNERNNYFNILDMLPWSYSCYSVGPTINIEFFEKYAFDDKRLQSGNGIQDTRSTKINRR